LKKTGKKLFLPVLVIIALALVPWRLTAQDTAPRVYTLDETIGMLGSAESKGAEFRWDPFFREGSFTVGGHYGVFPAMLSTGNKGFFMVDNREIYAVSLPYLEKGELVFPESFVNTAKDAFARSSNEDDSHYRISAIIVDPGHGGKEPGAIGNVTINGKQTRVVEKDITLKASKRLRDLLVKAYPDKRVLMTRESDITCSLEERTSIANSVPVRKNEAIIYISIHANASPSNRNARGYEVWHLSPDYRRSLLDESHFPESPDLRRIMNILTEESYMTESIRIAQSILDSMGTAMGKSMPSRGLKAEEWFVVRRSRMPAVLVELGFVTNSEDAVLMTNDAGLNKLVEAVYKGIADFVGDFERSGGFIAAR